MPTARTRALKHGAKCSVIVANEILRCRVPWERFSDLARQPLGRRIAGHCKPQQLPTFVTENKKCKELLKRNRRNHEQINRRKIVRAFFVNAALVSGRDFHPMGSPQRNSDFKEQHMTSADAQTGLSLSLAGPALLRALVYGRDGGASHSGMIHRTAAPPRLARRLMRATTLACRRYAQLNGIGSRGGNDGKRAVRERAGIDGCVLAGRKLPVGRPDLSLRQPAAQATTHKGSHQAAAPGSLGNHTRSQFHLRSPEPGDQEARPRHDLHYRPWAWRARPGCERLSRGNLPRGSSEHLSRRKGHEAPVHPVLVPRWHPEPRGA